jgi:hypothetical protein
MKRIIALGMVVIVSALFLGGCLEPSGTINGTVYVMQYQPLIMANVRTEPATTSVMTDNNASFSIPNVRPGLYKVIAEYGVANSGSEYVTVFADKTTTVAIIVRPDSLQ